MWASSRSSQAVRTAQVRESLGAWLRMEQRWYLHIPVQKEGSSARNGNRILGGKASAVKADSASAEEVQAAVARQSVLSVRDIFVSNAGILVRGTIDIIAWRTLTG